VTFFYNFNISRCKFFLLHLVESILIKFAKMVPLPGQENANKETEKLKVSHCLSSVQANLPVNKVIFIFYFILYFFFFLRLLFTLWYFWALLTILIESVRRKELAELLAFY